MRDWPVSAPPSPKAHLSHLSNALAHKRICRYFRAVSTVAEIESAIEKLSSGEVAQLAAWLEEYQQMINASSQIFGMYDREEEEGK